MKRNRLKILRAVVLSTTDENRENALDNYMKEFSKKLKKKYAQENKKEIAEWQKNFFERLNEKKQT